MSSTNLRTRMGRTARGFQSRASQGGVTLLELMTVVVILSILATVSVSSYRRYLIRANRTEAKGALLRVQVAQEKYYLQNRTYVVVSTELDTKLGIKPTTESGKYAVTLAVGGTGAAASSYLATATAQGQQATADATCATLSIDNNGARTPGDATGCWK